MKVITHTVRNFRVDLCKRHSDSDNFSPYEYRGVSVGLHKGRCVVCAPLDDAEYEDAERVSAGQDEDGWYVDDPIEGGRWRMTGISVSSPEETIRVYLRAPVLGSWQESVLT